MTRHLLISDANILIDMIDGGISDELFQLEYTFGVPDVLFEYELKEQHPELLDKGLSVMSLEGTFMEMSFELNAQHRSAGLSVNDCMALVLAKQEKCPLLTGDAALRQISILEQVEVRGTLWLVRQLFLASIITVEQASLAYDAMKRAGSRLPWAEVAAQLSEFRSS